MNRAKAVCWKTVVWLLFNLGAQLIPVGYLLYHHQNDPGPFWEYVNCTLMVLIAVGMFFAVLSDLVTEQTKPLVFGWGALILVVFLLLVLLHRSIHDEFLKGIKPDDELLLSSLVVGVTVIGLGAFLKAGIWYNQWPGEAGEHH